MKVKIWGSRGSHPLAITAESFQERVRLIMERIRYADLESDEKKELFLSTLPDWLWNLPGGNTPCIEVQLENGISLIFDAGTGIIPLSKNILSRNTEQVFHIFFTHFHYDHIQGLPFFSQLYKPTSTIHFYSPVKDLQNILYLHMRDPFFPMTMNSALPSQQNFHILDETHPGKNRLRIKNAEIYWKEVNHPGTAYAYKITENNQSLVIATDFEILPKDFERTNENILFFANNDVLILDTMYTLGEAIDKFDWGHSSFSLGVDFAQAWNTKSLFLFHHDPQNTDKKLYDNLLRARLYAQKQNFNSLNIEMAIDNCEIIL